MSWEEYVKLTRTILEFYALTKEQQELILLSIDGLKFRSENEQI